jgi:hypothetical protein
VTRSRLLLAVTGAGAAAAALGLTLAVQGTAGATVPGGAVDSAAGERPGVRCELSDERLTEVSGITWSRRHPGTYWVHNDSSGGPYLYAIDGGTCRTLARVRVDGIEARDLEAVATGVSPDGDPVLWLGDIGDNNDSWDSVRLHAVPEPARLVDTEVRATTYEFTYADRPHNAEALLVRPDEPTVWVVTKQLARGAVWRVPLEADGVATARRVAEVRGLVTDAAYSPDGTEYVLRDYLGVTLHRAPVSAATLADGGAIDVPAQPQGEAITFTADGTALLLVSEGSREVREVPLAVTSLPTDAPTASPSGSQEPDPGPTHGAGASGEPGEDAAASGPSAATYALAGAAALLGIGGALLAARRLRH